MATECFWCERTDLYRRSLRRFQHTNGERVCPVHGYHTAHLAIEDVPARDEEYEGDTRLGWPHDDPRWPARCACGYEFQEEDEWQVSEKRLYRAPDGALYETSELPPGAMYESRWLAAVGWVGEDGRSLSVVLPDGSHWCVDSKASNCTRKDEHRCWVRHGVPPAVTVDKNGNTCQAGAGSVGTPRYHGFLRDGVLVEA